MKSIMRTTIMTDDAGRVTITYTDAITDERLVRTFRAPIEGGYVRELDGRGGSTQPCERLAGTGSTLMASRGTLEAVIRREYRAMRRTERRLMGRRG